MGKHTPGPWEIVGIPYDGYEDPCIYSTVAKNSWGEPQYVAQTVYDMQSVTIRETIEADTHLIAAAPELLEACEKVMYDFDTLGYGRLSIGGWGMLLDAIKKARGGDE